MKPRSPHKRKGIFHRLSMSLRRLLTLSPLAALVHAGTIITSIAGNGIIGYSGDNGPATGAALSFPSGVALDAVGNVYIADEGNALIRKVTVSTGIITTVAGNGTPGYSGDNGPATTAQLYIPSGLAIDSAGNIYIADSDNNRIRKVTASTGTITTVAGNGTPGYSGDNSPAASAQLYIPTGVAVDSGGNIYIADSGNNRVRMVTVSTGMITTVAGNGSFGSSGDNGPAASAELDLPCAVAVDPSGNIFLADQLNNRIRKVTLSTGLINTVAGNGTSGYNGDNGPATAAQLWQPAGVTVDAAGNIYIADQFNQRIRKVAAPTGTISTIAGNGTLGFSGDNGPAINAELDGPSGVVIDSSGDIYIADSGNNRIRKVSATGSISGVGIYRSSNGLWLENSQFNNVFTAADTVTLFAGSGLTPQPGDLPVVGDWSGTGTSKIGLYRPSTGTWFLDYNGNGVYDGPVTDRQYQYGGISDDIPVVGDWNGSGFSKLGIFRSGFLWLLDTNGNGVFDSGDQVFAFGGATGCTGPLPSFYSTEPAGSCDVPVVGDWDSSGTTKVAIVRAIPGTSQPFLWILDTTGSHVFGPSSTIFAFGGVQGDVPVVGDWTGSGTAKIGVFRDGFFWVEDTTASMPAPPSATDTISAFSYGGIPGDIPVVGHW